MPDLAAQIRAVLDAWDHRATIIETTDVLSREQFNSFIEEWGGQTAPYDLMRVALLAVLDATDPAQLPPNGCDGDGCLALWVRHRIAVALGIEADDG